MWLTLDVEVRGIIIFPAAQVIGEDGLIFAVDVQKPVLSQIAKRCSMQALHQIHTVWSNIEYIEKTAIPEKTLDIVFLVNTLCQGENRHAMLEEAKRLLKPKGRIMIVDWHEAPGALGPSHDRLVDQEELVTWARMHGLGLQEQFSAGPYHFGVSFIQK